MKPIPKLMKGLEGQPFLISVVVTLLLMLAVAGIDFTTGSQVMLSLLYLFPVSYAAWHLGFKYAAVSTFLCLIPSAVWRWKTGLYLEIPQTLLGPATGKLLLFLSMALILAKLKKTLELQKEINSELLQSYEKCQKLSEIKADFTTRVSHDLRAPLAAIKQGIEVLSEGVLGEMSAEQSECLDLAKRNIDRLKHLIDEILDFSQLDKGKRVFRFERHDFCRELEEVAALFRPLAVQKGVELKTDFDPENIWLRFDKTSIHQIMNNLMSNAMKFTEKGSVTIGAKTSGGFVHAYVKDTGPGIREESLKRLFIPFEKLMLPNGKHYEGAGLGLVISKQLVEQHGGKIWAESHVGAGTTFQFTLSSNLPD